MWIIWSLFYAVLQFPLRFLIRQYMNSVSCKLSMRTAWLATCSDLGTARARPVPSDQTRNNFSAVSTLLLLFSSQCKSHLPACSSFYSPQPLPDLHFYSSAEETNWAADLSFGNSLCFNASTTISTKQVRSPKKEKSRSVFLDQCITTGCDVLFSSGWHWWPWPQGWVYDRQELGGIHRSLLMLRSSASKHHLRKKLLDSIHGPFLYIPASLVHPCKRASAREQQITLQHKVKASGLYCCVEPWYEIPSCSIPIVKVRGLAVCGKFWDLGLSLHRRQAEFFNW